METEHRFEEIPFLTPLKFGTGIIETITCLNVRVRVENRQGKWADGIGQVLLSVIWAFPSQAISLEKRDHVLRQLGEEYGKYLSVALKDEYIHPLYTYHTQQELLYELEAKVTAMHNLPEPIPHLAGLLCSSPWDAALHDAFGKVNQVSTWAAYGPEFSSMDLSAVLGCDFKGQWLSSYLRYPPAQSLPVFHLVGGADRLTAHDKGMLQQRETSGMPETLQEWIRQDGVYCFKVKLTGTDLDWDVERTVDVSKVAQETLKKLGRRDYFLSVDSNEMHESPDVVVEYLLRLKEKAPDTYARLLYVEQPIARDLTTQKFDMRKVAKLKPVVVDESVTSLEQLDLARELGWSGVALKTCKGQTASLLYIAKAVSIGLSYTVQDLTNPGYALIHSAMLAAHSQPLMGFEYNSRQYLPDYACGLDVEFPELFKVKDGRIVIPKEDDLTGLGYPESRKGGSELTEQLVK